uniref:Uncharacterized protein n=1 Tax=Anguilla anguilla TaxID=7936 RepID=A0A0E9T2R8_ANGAN
MSREKLGTNYSVSELGNKCFHAAHATILTC